MDPIADHRADAEFPHLARRVSDDPVLVLEENAKPAVGQNLVDLTLQGHESFFGHILQILARMCPDAKRAGG
jgi:hypothetical protein